MNLAQDEEMEDDRNGRDLGSKSTESMFKLLTVTYRITNQPLSRLISSIRSLPLCVEDAEARFPSITYMLDVFLPLR